MISAVARHVAFFIYRHFNLIDLSGPLDAFAVATDMAPGSYRFTVMSLEGGEIESGPGAKVMSEVAAPEGIDTLIIVGDARMADARPRGTHAARRAFVWELSCSLQADFSMAGGRRPIGALPRGCRPCIRQCGLRETEYSSTSAASGHRPA